VWYPLIPAPESLHQDLNIRPSELSAIYLGCRANPIFSKEIIALTNATFPKTRIYRMQKSKTSYAWDHEEI
jgi:hypothetical protein